MTPSENIWPAALEGINSRWESGAYVVDLVQGPDGGWYMRETTEVGAVAGPSSEAVAKLQQVAARLGIPEWRWIAAVIQHEAQWKPSIVNADSKATGLIQFLPSTARALGTTVEALAKMTAVQQLDYVEKYFRAVGKPIKTAADVASAVFYPVAVGRGPGYVIANKGKKAYDWNKGLDWEGKGFITVGDYMRSLQKFGLRWGVTMDQVADYIAQAKGAQTYNDLIKLCTRVLVENSKNSEAVAAFSKFQASVAKAAEKAGGLSTALPPADDLDYRSLAEAKIRGAFHRSRDYKPTVADYAAATVQTVQDVGTKATEAVAALPSVLPIAAGGLALLALVSFFRR